MKTLIAEDEFTSGLILKRVLSNYGETRIAANGIEAIEAFISALAGEAPYDLVCLDIMMPERDGQDVLREIRAIEASRGIYGLDGVKVIMTTAVGGSWNVLGAFRSQCEAYLVKPIDAMKLIQEVRSLGLLEKEAS